MNEKGTKNRLNFASDKPMFIVDERFFEPLPEEILAAFEGDPRGKELWEKEEEKPASE